MCFSNKQPAAPITTPSYAPEEAHLHFDVTKTAPDGTKTTLNSAPEETAEPSKPVEPVDESAKPATFPAWEEPIRM